MTLPPVSLSGVLSPVRDAVHIHHDTGVETPILIDEGRVTIDRGSVARRVADVRVVDGIDPALLCAPHRIRLRAGYRVDGTDYLASLAHVRIGRPRVSPLGGVQLSSCRSFEALVKVDRFGTPRALPGGTSMVASMTSLIREAVPWATVSVATDVDALIPPGGVTHERERWAAIAGEAESMATALGLDVACDGDGVFVIREKTAPQVWAASDADLIVDWAQESDPDTVVNAWTCMSDHPEVAAVWGEALDDDPYSPTRVSRWGVSRQYHSSPYYSAAWQCEAAARSFLATSRGQSVSLDLSTVPNPWLDEHTAISATLSGQTVLVALDRIVHEWAIDRPTSVTAAARAVSVA